METANVDKAGTNSANPGTAGGVAASGGGATAGLLVDTRIEGGVCRIVLNRPDKMNALSAAMVEQLHDALDRAHAERCALIVLSGAGRNFSAGFDFGDVDAQSEGDLLLRFVRIEMLLQKLAGSPCLTAAFAHGKNFGAGVDLYAACRLRYCTPEASFRMPGLKFGLVLGSRRFADLVGRETARRILEQARAFAADEALAMGFAQQALAQDQWPAAEAEAAAAAGQLDGQARAGLYAALDAGDADRDLAALARSAARPGLKRRILAYLGRS